MRKWCGKEEEFYKKCVKCGFPAFCFGCGSILVLKLGDFFGFSIFGKGKEGQDIDEGKLVRTKRQKSNMEKEKTKSNIEEKTRKA